MVGSALTTHNQSSALALSWCPWPNTHPLQVTESLVIQGQVREEAF